MIKKQGFGLLTTMLFYIRAILIYQGHAPFGRASHPWQIRPTLILRNQEVVAQPLIHTWILSPMNGKANRAARLLVQVWQSKCYCPFDIQPPDNLPLRSCPGWHYKPVDNASGEIIIRFIKYIIPRLSKETRFHACQSKCHFRVCQSKCHSTVAFKLSNKVP